VKVETVSGRAIPVRGDDIDTDRIIPARFLRCVTFDGLGEHAFEDDRQQNPDHAFNQDRYKGASVLLSADNFGCGSSREHAPQALQRWGINGFAGKSFAEIFFGNCVALGIPCFVLKPEDAAAAFAAVEADPSTEVVLDVNARTVAVGDTTYQATLPDGPREQFLEGTWNAMSVLQEAGEAIDAVDARLPVTKSNK
jgi:3-isopropylmalate/(R)-2-methylmalate dehydratase small subunit